MTDPTDRRAENQWIRDGFANTNNQMGELGRVIKASEERIDKDLAEVKTGIGKLDKLLRDSVPKGMTPEKHAISHEVIAADHAAREEAEAEAKQFRKEVIGKVKMAVVMASLTFFVGLMSLGFAAKFKQWVITALGGVPVVETTK